MAKKVTIETLMSQLGELEAKEKTAAVMEEIDAVKAQIAAMEADAKALAEEVAKAEAEKARIAAEKEAKKKKPRFSTYEVWKMEWKGMGDKRELVKVNVKKTVKILKEHADILNEQTENTLLKYVRKEA